MDSGLWGLNPNLQLANLSKMGGTVGRELGPLIVSLWMGLERPTVRWGVGSPNAREPVRQPQEPFPAPLL